MRKWWRLNVYFSNPAWAHCLCWLTARGKTAPVRCGDRIQCDSQEILTFPSNIGSAVVLWGAERRWSPALWLQLRLLHQATTGSYRKLQEAWVLWGGGWAHGSTCSSPRTERYMFSHQHPNIPRKSLDLELLAADRETKTQKWLGKLPYLVRKSPGCQHWLWQSLQRARAFWPVELLQLRGSSFEKTCQYQ